jgi:hypothetical protein
MWAGCYALDPYCDNDGGAETYKRKDGGQSLDAFGHAWGEFPHQYSGEVGSECRARG